MMITPWVKSSMRLHSRPAPAAPTLAPMPRHVCILSWSWCVGVGVWTWLVVLVLCSREEEIHGLDRRGSFVIRFLGLRRPLHTAGTSASHPKDIKNSSQNHLV